MVYEILEHFVCNLYDESTVLHHEIVAASDEEAIEIAREWAKPFMDREEIRRVILVKDGRTIVKIK